MSSRVGRPKTHLGMLRLMGHSEPPPIYPQGGVARRFARSEWGGTSVRIILYYLFQPSGLSDESVTLLEVVMFQLSQPPAVKGQMQPLPAGFRPSDPHRELTRGFRALRLT